MAEKDTYPHYVFLQRVPVDEKSTDVVNEEHWNKQEVMMREFGINVIWYKEFDDLPDLIREIMM